MKNIKILFSAAIIAAGLIVGCESDEEKFSGSPVDNNSIVTLQSEISTTETQALLNQNISFSVDLKRTFTDTVAVEVTVLNKAGGRVRKSFEVLPHVQVLNDSIASSGGSVFNSTVDMFVSGISLNTAEPAGTHYLMTSNTITLRTGSTSVPSNDPTRLQLKFAWLYASSSSNNLKVFIDRPNALSYMSAPGATNSADGKTITVSSTLGLVKGMAVTVSSGIGKFPPYTTVSNVLSDTQFEISQPKYFLGGNLVNAYVDLGSNAVVSAGGGDKYTETGAATVLSGSRVQLSSGTTDGIVPGMLVSVTSGTGRIKASAYVTEIISATEFKYFANVIGAPAGIALGADTVLMLSYPDELPETNGGAIHSILNNPENNNQSTSTPSGDYYVTLSPLNLIPGTTDLPYRLVWKKPDGSDAYYDGIYENIAIGAPAKLVLKVTKTGSGSSATYVVTPF